MAKLRWVLGPKVEDEKQCHDCGWFADDPYCEYSAEDIERRRWLVLCSTCNAVRKHQYKLKIDADRHARLDGGQAPVCECGYSMRECRCEFFNCGGIEVKPEMAARQLNLFRDRASGEEDDERQRVTSTVEDNDDEDDDFI